MRLRVRQRRGASRGVARLAVSALALGLALAAAPEPARACCTAYAADARVSIADQEILIVFDEARHLEHFVRRAAFEANAARDFGFLVPTPSKPELSEAKSAVFDTLRETIAPVRVRDWQLDWTPLVLYTFSRASKSAAVAASADVDPVRVLEQTAVAGYDAAVLEADDATALARWLREHGYDARPEIEEWVKPYVAARWKITAFKYARGAAPAAAGEVATGSVCLSFATDRALFPYRVPTDQLAKPGAQHLLRVFFAGTERVDGALGGAAGGPAPHPPAPWAGTVRYAKRVDALPALLAGAVPAGAADRAAWLTVFDDPTWPSGRDDLFFDRARDPSPVVPTIRDPKTLPAPLDLLGCVVGGGYWLSRRRSRRRRAG